MNQQELAESWRLLGALELLPVNAKKRIGELIIKRLKKHREPSAASAAELWALGRLGTREPVYGPLNSVVPADVAAAWAQTLVDGRLSEPLVHLAAMQLTRRTGDRFRDVSQSSRTSVLRWFDIEEAPEHLRQLVEVGGKLEAEEQQQILGDDLPVGLHLR